MTPALDVVRDARLVSLCGRQSLRKSLEQIIDQLNRCQKALNQFLEVSPLHGCPQPVFYSVIPNLVQTSKASFQEKRSAFPRFYFLGDDDLLEILGQSTNPTVIQSHLKKLFQVCLKTLPIRRRYSPMVVDEQCSPNPIFGFPFIIMD